MAKKSTPMIKATGAKRIKLCSCAKDDKGVPLETLEFRSPSEKGEDFIGLACDKCFEIINYKRDEKVKDNETGAGEIRTLPSTFNS